MPHSRKEREQELRDKYEFIVFDGEFSLFNAALVLVDVFVTGGTFTVEYIKSVLKDWGEDVITRMVEAGIDPTSETIYGGVMTFENWERPFGVKVYLPDKYVPYIAARKRQPTVGTPPLSNYQQRGLETGTALHVVGADDGFVFLLAPNLDIFAIKKSATGTGSTEVHVLSAASNYQKFALQTGTPLGEAGTDRRIEYMLGKNRDLYMILKNGTGSRTTEVHMLTAASNYQQFGLHTATALGETESNNTAFLLADNGDIFMLLKTATGTGTTEVHVLTAASGYQQFGLQTGTSLGETGTDSRFAFLLAPNRDIYAIMKEDTGTLTTEVHVLTAASAYLQRGLETGTALGQTGTDSRFVFLLAPNLDIYAIMKDGTGTNSTEVHVLKH